MLFYVDDFVRVTKYEATKNIYSCVIQAQGTDIYPGNLDGLKRCYEEGAFNVGFTVTKFDQALSTGLKRPQNYFYVDQRLTAGEIPSVYLKHLKFIRGPKGNPLKIKFTNGLEKAYTTLCFGDQKGCIEGGCLKDSLHECDCPKRASSKKRATTTDERADAQRRRIAAFEDSFAEFK